MIFSNQTSVHIGHSDPNLGKKEKNIDTMDLPEFPREFRKTVRQSLEGTRSRPWRTFCCWLLSQIPAYRCHDVDMLEFDSRHRRCDIHLYQLRSKYLHQVLLGSSCRLCCLFPGFLCNLYNFSSFLESVHCLKTVWCLPTIQVEQM